MKMKLRDFLEEEIDIDVCDDYDESCWIAFCGPCKLTEKGKETFAEILDDEVDLRLNSNPRIGNMGILHVDTVRQLKLYRKLFLGYGGLCSVTEWDELFNG